MSVQKAEDTCYTMEARGDESVREIVDWLKPVSGGAAATTSGLVLGHHGCRN